MCLLDDLRCGGLRLRVDQVGQLGDGMCGRASRDTERFNVLPQFQFGTVSGGSSMNFTRVNTTAGNYENFNPIWTYTDNLSKVVGKHSFKFGGYLENNHKIQPSGPAYSGSFNFSPDALNGVNNTGNGYANGLLGYVDSYQQATGRAVFNTQYWNAEFLDLSYKEIG